MNAELAAAGGFFVGLYTVTWLIGWAGVLVMASLAAVNVGEFRRYRDERIGRRLQAPVRKAMDRPLFWIAFWISTVAVVVNTFVPLVLLPTVPVMVVGGLLAANVVSNILAVPFRVWLWRLRLT